MGLAREFMIGNTKIKIWEIRANPERYYAVLEMKERGEEWPDEKCCRAEMVERYIEKRKKERGADGKF